MSTARLTCRCHEYVTCGGQAKMVRIIVLPLLAIFAVPSISATAVPDWHMLRAEMEGYATAACLTRQEQPFRRKQGHLRADCILERVGGSLDHWCALGDAVAAKAAQRAIPSRVVTARCTTPSNPCCFSTTSWSAAPPFVPQSGRGCAASCRPACHDARCRQRRDGYAHLARSAVGDRGRPAGPAPSSHVLATDRVAASA